MWKRSGKKNRPGLSRYRWQNDTIGGSSSVFQGGSVKVSMAFFQAGSSVCSSSNGYLTSPAGHNQQHKPLVCLVFFSLIGPFLVVEYHLVILPARACSFKSPFIPRHTNRNRRPLTTIPVSKHSLKSAPNWRSISWKQSSLSLCSFLERVPRRKCVA